MVLGLRKAIKKQQEIFLYNEVDIASILYGEKSPPFNREVVRRNKIIPAPLNIIGGPIVSVVGDLNFLMVTKDKTTWCTDIRETFVEWLKFNNLNAEIHKNDMLIAGKKFSGSTHFMQNGMNCEGFMVAMKNSEALVRQICTKPMEKVPTGLEDYGITKNDVFEFVLRFTEEWLENNRI
jgi:lipoate-protein ligase A